ncbi:MAG TPA: DEAD/DEAH box helicase [Lachnospiraceae bacterium]|nr:DEAD/DEAH box helicase [Lachnospiraceae bacterium]
MDKQGEKYFAALSEKRSRSADALEDFALRGAKTSVVEKYSDQAHFIYELLQNADDALATNARFILEKNRLIFAHNGSRHFSVSDPATEEKDYENGKLGDINSITSIGNSNKTEASIGKFGVGFKAVFQYTSTPHIYDPEFRFKIDRFIVPTLIEDDFPGRHSDETLFVFPFDHHQRKPEEAYSDIAEKLRKLSFPLLFLTRLKDIEFDFGNTIGLYGKTIKKTYTFGDTTAEHICLTQNDGDDLYDENLWLFSRADDNDHRYSVGYFMDKEGHLRPVMEPAFCFFPTKEMTGLNFIIHAPFLLTDSREGIRAGVEHNNRMIKLLAELSADALVYLKEIGEKESYRMIEDNIVTIIPVDSDRFSNPEDRRKVSFLPFYDSIKEKLEEEELLPSTEGYASSENAYWAEYPQFPVLFSNSQLTDIVGNENAKWVFTSLGRYETNRNNKALFAYLDPIVRTNLNEDAIISGRTRQFYYNAGERKALEPVKGITAEFIEKQPVAWLHDFYKWMSETKKRTESSKTGPIFLDQDKNAVAAFDDNEQLILFLPVKNIDMSGYTVVNPELLDNEDTRKFIEDIGVKQPSLRDQIYNIILPQYKEGAEIDTDPHFMLFFEYYCKCSNEEVDEFIDLIKDCEFLTYYKKGDEQPYRGAARFLYIPTAELRVFFETKDDVLFIALDEYKELVGKEKEKQLLSFLDELGVKDNIDILDEPVDYYESGRSDLPRPHSTRGWRYSERNIEGCREIVRYIVENEDETKSVLLWNCLLKIIETKCNSYNNRTLSNLLRGKCSYFYYSAYNTCFQSSDAVLLKTSKWIFSGEGIFASPDELSVDELPAQYDRESDAAQDLIRFLGIKQDEQDEAENEEDTSYLTDEQKEKIDLANKLKAAGIENEEDLAEAAELLRQKRAAKPEIEPPKPEDGSPSDNSASTQDGDIKDIFDENDDSGEGDKDTEKPRNNHKINPTTKNVVKDIVKRTKEAPSGETQEDFEEEVDSDDLTPSTVDYCKRIEKAKEKSAAEIDKIAYFEELQNKAVNADKYSYAWFNVLLEMEGLNSGEANANSKEVSISFSVVEREPGTKRTLVLKHPDRYIPQFMEDLADIPMVLHMGDQKKTVAIEVANIKSYTLRVKMKNAEDIQGIDLSSVTAVTIDAKSPVFLIEELRKQFKKLGEERHFDDSYNMQEHLCENIEFVFGPPGTGKTTYLAKNVLLPFMCENDKCSVLVLTPTNKAADVLVRRIMEISGDDHTYEDWLIRFGGTGDEEIEQSKVFRDKNFNIRALDKNVIVTTIARFPYDYFMSEGNWNFLYGLNWDYIVIDEASMIPLANIIFPLYKKTPKKFIIAGDPFQIEPITSIDLWKNENIYTLVNLNSFTDPKTIPYQYKIELLTTQYRSIPDIGSIFSNFAYGGILKHYRSAESQKPLNIDEKLGVKTLNILKYPVSKYESIYRAKRLQHSSSYQVYSALFTFEYVCYLSKAIAERNQGKLLKIGIIAPYRAQADVIDKLIASEKMPQEVDVQVGTIHGFQGDECDIIFAVFNTPPTISASKEMFLNKKNIINVSISRARDYLFVVMPDDNTENIGNLRLVKRVEALIKSTKSWHEVQTPDMEEMMFGDRNYLENNAFSTSHQSVNVYGLPEKCYEVRTEDNAVDVQIHRSAPRAARQEEVKQQDGVLSMPDAVGTETENIEPDKPTEQKAESVQDGFEPTEDLIPKALRTSAVEVQVNGKRAGKYYLVPYNGKLKSYTIKKATAMFIPQERSGKEKLVSVSVIESDHLIFIMKDSYKMYQKGLTDSEGIELRKTFYE